MIYFEIYNYNYDYDLTNKKTKVKQKNVSKTNLKESGHFNIESKSRTYDSIEPSYLSNFGIISESQKISETHNYISQKKDFYKEKSDQNPIYNKNESDNQSGFQSRGKFSDTIDENNDGFANNKKQ